MKMQYHCKNEGRKAAISKGSEINGIDYLEVSEDQKTLTVYFIHNLPGQDNQVPPPPAPPLTPNNVIIRGGVRVKDIEFDPEFNPPVYSSGNILTIHVKDPGDFSLYTLYLIGSAIDNAPPKDFDSHLSSIEFSFKINCQNEFDCKSTQICPPEKLPEPSIDYLAKDYASFRRLILDRLSAIMPDWEERNPADLGTVLVELLAYAADHLSYYQDAVATEAYLGTARKRVSVRRHARLLDYFIHEGCNARAWVQVKVNADNVVLEKGTQLMTRLPGYETIIKPDTTDHVEALAQQPEIFETMHDITLFQAHNTMQFYTWGDNNCCLPRGSTRATLRNEGNELENLAPGDVLIFEEIRGPHSDRKEDADPTHRHTVRLQEVIFRDDPLFMEDTQAMRVVDICWDLEDALPFPLCLWEVEDIEHPDIKLPISVARGNIVLADHGHTIAGEELEKISRPALTFDMLTCQGRVRNHENELVTFDPEASASAAFKWEMSNVLPSVIVLEDGIKDNPWLPMHDLLNSSRFAREFVVEMEEDRLAYLRFGDGVLGRRPTSDLSATYRVGNGRSGNVGATSIFHVITTESGIERMCNPLPAKGGTDPERTEDVKLYAPQAFQVQQRAVTEADYAEVSQRHPDVQKAVATRRWTGSWYTLFITVDRKGGRPIDAEFEADLCAFLERFRLACHDVEIEPPSFVALDIAFTVCVAPGYFRAHVKKMLLDVFSNRDLPDGTRGFFHPDNFTFGQPVYLSQVVAAIMQVPGVLWVDTSGIELPPVPKISKRWEQPSRGKLDEWPIKIKKPETTRLNKDKDLASGSNRFQRWKQPSRSELDEGLIKMERLEIARLDNDPNAMENGKIDFYMEGGL